MIPTLLSLVASEIVVTTTSGASNAKDSLMTHDDNSWPFREKKAQVDVLGSKWSQGPIQYKDWKYC